jgi:hypothetical protein
LPVGHTGGARAQTDSHTLKTCGDFKNLSCCARFAEAPKMPMAGQGPAIGGFKNLARACSALARLEAGLGLVDHVEPALAADEAIVAMTAPQGFQRVTNFHSTLWRVFARAVRQVLDG